MSTLPNSPPISGLAGPDGVAVREGDSDAAVLRLGAVVSIVQSALFVVIGVAGLLLGVDALVDGGFASLAASEPTAFRVLCAAFVLIAVLGVAITPAERMLIEPASPALARFGASLAYLGHGGTIVFFSWWLVASVQSTSAGGQLDVIAPIDWGVMFELVFVGAWVWIMAAAMRGPSPFPAGFVWFSVAKAASFWFTFAAFLTDNKLLIVVGLATVAFGTGPVWHAWIARLFAHRIRERRDGR